MLGASLGQRKGWPRPGKSASLCSLQHRSRRLSASEAKPLFCSPYGSKLLKARKLAVDGTTRQLKHRRREVRAISSLAFFVTSHGERRCSGVVPTSMGEGGRSEQLSSSAALSPDPRLVAILSWMRPGDSLSCQAHTFFSLGRVLCSAWVQRHSLAVSLSAGVLELVDVALWEDGSSLTSKKRVVGLGRSVSCLVAGLRFIGLRSFGVAWPTANSEHFGSKPPGGT